MDVKEDVLKRWYKVDLNPLPWTMGPIQRSKKGVFVGKHQGLAQYQEGIKSSLRDQNAIKVDGLFRMEIFFWRKIEEYETAQARRARNKEADATNMQKAFEDGCAKVLFDNDKENRWVTSLVVEQNATCEPKIIFSIEPISKEDLYVRTFSIPDSLMENSDQEVLFEKDYNSWPQRN